MTINGSTTAVELAALVSQTLEVAGIKATLSGGGAVSIYTDNEYRSKDLDFVTAERREQLPVALRVITPTLCVMDRLAAYWHWKDRQSWDQAVMVARHRDVDYDELVAYATEEGADPNDIGRLHKQAGR